MKKETSIVPFEIAVKNMEYNIPEDPQNTTKTGRSSVKNAWNNCTYIDSMGIMWIEKSRIDGILRTNKVFKFFMNCIFVWLCNNKILFPSVSFNLQISFQDFFFSLDH